MYVSDVISNPNFSTDFPYVVRSTDGAGEVLQEYCSWERPVPSELKQSEVFWLTVVNGYGTMPQGAVMVIDVFLN